MVLRVTFFLNLKKRSQEFLLSVSLNLNTVKPPVSDHLKWEALVAAYGRWPFTRVETQGVFSKKRSGSGHIFAYNFLVAICVISVLGRSQTSLQLPSVDKMFFVDLRNESSCHQF